MARLVRALNRADTDAALALYADLTLGPKECAPAAFHAVLSHPGTTVFGAMDAEALLGMATLHILPNVTWGGRPYGLIENVVTAPNHRREGVGRSVLEAAITRAWDADAYKLMLMTRQKRGAKGFYEAVGFSAEDKHAMVIRRGGPSGGVA